MSHNNRHWPWSLASYGIGAGCLYWVFHDISFSALWTSLDGIHWWWLGPAVVLDLLVYACAGWEWHFLLKPVGRLSVREGILAVFAGRFANDVLPVHAGYVIRVYLASQWMGTDLARIIPSLLIERFFDGLWLAIGIGLTSLFFPMPPGLARAGEVLGALIIGGAVIVAWIVLRKRKGTPGRHTRTGSAGKLWHKVARFSQKVEEGIRGIGRSKLVLVALGLSIGKLILQALAFLACLNAYDFGFSFWVKLAVFMITYIGISVPSTPASLGVFQLFSSAALVHFGVAKPVAGGCALLAYVVLTAPLAIAGFIAITRSGLTLQRVRQELRHWH